MVPVEPGGGVVEGCAVMQLIAEIVMNGMLADEARRAPACPTHLVRHQHLCAGGFERVVSHHVCRSVKLSVVQVGLQSIAD